MASSPTRAGRRAPVLWVLFAVAVGVLPLYPTFWWWDLAAHALASVAILSVARLRSRSWRVPVAALVGLSVAWEWGEYLFPQPWLIVPTVADTLSDLTVMFLVGYLYYRVVEAGRSGGT